MPAMDSPRLASIWTNHPTNQPDALPLRNGASAAFDFATPPKRNFSPSLLGDNIAARTFNSMSPGWNLGSDQPRPKLTAGSLTHQAADGDALTSDFWRRYQCVKSVEQQKNSLIEDLIIALELKEKELAKAEAGREYVQNVYHRERLLEGNIERLKDLMDRDPFLLVLIDGNGLLFDDALVAQGEAGGTEAAARLYQNTLKYAANERPDIPPECRIVVRVYLDSHFLGDNYAKAGIVESPTAFGDFIKAFGRARELFDVVDMSGASEASFAKVLANLRLHLFDFHCRQILLGCSPESPYAESLEPLVNDQQCLQRITLLEGAPMEKSLDLLPFASTKLHNSFRNTRLKTRAERLNHKQSLNALANGYSPAVSRTNSEADLRSGVCRMPQARVASAAATDCSSKPSPGFTWASAVQKAVPSSPSSASVKTISRSQSAIALTSASIPRNRRGQRVDPTIKHDKEEVDRVKKLKMCNVHFLRGECPYGDSCTHVHRYKPTAAELKTLTLVARMAPCMHGSDCEDPKCIYGHVCPAPEGKDGRYCIFGDNCRFPNELHKVDRQVVKVVKV